MWLTSTAEGIVPAEYADLLLTPVLRDALAFQPELTTTIKTRAHEMRFPVLLTDMAAAWTPEGEEITPSDPVTDEVTVTPAKVAGLAVVSRELAEDSSPEAAEVVGESLARAIVAQLNKAFVGNMAAPAPAGLASLTGLVSVDTGATLTNLDPLATAVAEAENEGANITAWLASPDDALALALLKTATGSNETLLNERAGLGRPIIVGKDLTAGTLYGIDRTKVYAVVREDVRIDVSDQSFFTSDRIAIRGTVRASWAFMPGAVVKLMDVA
jgi:HK97 family phage major capsid protein